MLPTTHRAMATVDIAQQMRRPFGSTGVSVEKDVLLASKNGSGDYVDSEQAAQDSHLAYRKAAEKFQAGAKSDDANLFIYPTTGKRHCFSLRSRGNRLLPRCPESGLCSPSASPPTLSREHPSSTTKYRK